MIKILMPLYVIVAHYADLNFKGDSTNTFFKSKITLQIV